MAYLLSIIGALIGGLFFYRTKAKSAEALNENVETKSAVNEIQAGINKDEARIAVEQSNIKDQQEKLADSKKEKLDDKSLVDFFNSINKPKS